MAPPRRPSKTTSPSPVPLSFPGVALSLFAAIAAGFVASRALKKRSSLPLPAQSTHLSSTAPPVFPDLLRSLPNDSSSTPPSPSSSFRFSNDDPVVEVTVRQEIAHESQDEERGEKVEEQFPVAEVSAVVAVEKDSITGPECSLRVNESNTTAVKYNLEVQAPGQVDKGGLVRVLIQKIPESIEPQRGTNGAAEVRVEAFPVEEGRKESEEVGKRVVDGTIELTSSVDVNNAPIQAKEGPKEQSSSEQSSVLVNGKTLESASEEDSEEDHDGSSNGRRLSEGTSCSVDSEGSLQEVTSSVVKPLDPCLEEGEVDKVGAHCAEIRPSELDSFTKDRSAHSKESNELTTGDKAQTIGAHFFDQSTKELLLKVDFILNSDENVGAALISPKVDVSIELQSDKQPYPIAHESAQAQEGVDPVMLNGVVISQPSDCKENSFQKSDPEISAEGGTVHEFRKAPQSTVATPNDGTMAAENKQDSTFEIIDVEAGMEPVEEATDARPAMKTESNGESFNPGENLTGGKQLLGKEENLQSEEEKLNRCSSSEDNEVRLYTESSAQNEETRPEELDATKGLAESSNNIDAEADHLSSNSSFEQKVSPKGQRQSDPQDGLSETLQMKSAEQEEKQQTESSVSDQTFESERLIVEKMNPSENFQRSRELSGEQIHASITGKQSLLSTETPTAKLLKGPMLIKFAGHMPVEMALICVLIGLVSTVLWFLRSTSVSDITGVTAQN